MAEYIKREAVCRDCKNQKVCVDKSVCPVGRAPAADVVEVVRCGNCKHYGWEQEPCHGRVERFCKLHKGLVVVYGDAFCSYGERRESDG